MSELHLKKCDPYNKNPDPYQKKGDPYHTNIDLPDFLSELWV